MTLPPLKTEFEFLNHMYPKRSWYIKKQCIICHAPLESGKELVCCSKCRPLLLQLEEDLQGIDLSEYPGLKIDSACMMLALRDVLPQITNGHHYISLPQLEDQLSDNRNYQILLKYRPRKRITCIRSSELKRFGWRRSRGTGTYYRQAPSIESERAEA